MVQNFNRPNIIIPGKAPAYKQSNSNFWELEMTRCANWSAIRDLQPYLPFTPSDTKICFGPEPKWVMLSSDQINSLSGPRKQHPSDLYYATLPEKPTRASWFEPASWQLSAKTSSLQFAPTCECQLLSGPKETMFNGPTLCNITGATNTSHHLKPQPTVHTYV